MHLRTVIAGKWAALVLALLCLLMSTGSAGRAAYLTFGEVWDVAGLPAANKLGVAMVAQKFVHVILFASLGCTVARWRESRWGSAGLAGGLALTLGSEWIQTWSANRTASWRDVQINVASFLAAFAVTRLLVNP
ncbi:MAG: VanZ family protein [Bryobacterales bacterium]|nr:VanZ family protein [Bryobacterales bacterium]